MNASIRKLYGLTLLAGLALTAAAVAAPTAKKAPAKPAAKPKPKVGIKQTPQMAGAVGRFGDIYGLKSGWTFQLLSARISFEPFDDYSNLVAEGEQKLLVLQVAIKNNTPADLWFGPDSHQFQIQDSANQLYSGGAYRLIGAGGKEFSPTLKPGQGAGQDLNIPLEVAIPIAQDAKVTKIILQQGRKGSSEEVMRFFVAGTPQGDPKNVVAPSPLDGLKTPLKPGAFVPSKYFQFRINGVTFVPGPIREIEAGENRRFAIVNLTLKNPTSHKASMFDFLSADYGNAFFEDADGEKYVTSSDLGVMKANSDEISDGDLDAGKERNCRIAIPVPPKAELKTLGIGANGGRQWVFDASAWK